MPQMRAKLILLILVFLLLGLQYGLWLGDFGVLRYRQLKARVEAQIELNQGLTDRNRRLKAEVIDLKHGTDALEERARSQLGMIEEGEKFYQIIDEQDLPEKQKRRL